MATFEKFRNSFNPDSHIKGKQFEHFVKWFLENDLEWSTQVDQVWLWDDYPDRWGPDCGVDLVFNHKNGDVWAVQAKCYSPENPITKDDINTFLTESNGSEIDRRLLIASTDNISPNGKRTIDRQEKPVTCFLYSDFDASAIEYPDHISKLNTAKRKKRPTPKPHQLEAVDAVEKGFNDAERGQLIMACGTGKTFTQLWVKERLSAKLTLVLVPSLSLLSQTLREWTFAANTPFNVLCVCSDQSVGKRTQEDATIHSVKELPFPVTSKVEEIESFLEGDGHKVIFSTYQSSSLIAESQRNNDAPIFDLVVADEAHRCTGKVDSSFTVVLDNQKIKAKRRLFATATPRTYSSSLKKQSSEKGVEVASMDDTEVFGREFYTLNFGKAIELGELTDYQIVIAGVNNVMVAELIKNRELVKTETGYSTDAESLAAQIGLIKTIKKYDLKRMISFHSRVKRAESFSNDIQNAIKFIDEKDKPSGSLYADFVSGKMDVYKRRIKIEQLKEPTKGTRSLLSNSRCLSEGVDVPSLDGVAFIDPRKSQVDIVQSVGRAIRLSNKKKIGTIILSVFLEDGETAEESIEKSNFKPVWDVLMALKSHDDVFSYELDELRTSLGKRKDANGVGEKPSKIIFDLPSSVDQNFSNALTTHLVERATAPWYFWFGLLEKYVEREGRARVPKHFKTEDGFSLGSWVKTQRQSKKKNKLTPEQIKRLEALPEWSWDLLVDNWEEAYSSLFNYIKRKGHGRVPPSFKTEDGFNLRYWIYHQRIDKKNNKLTPEKIKRLEALPNWSWDLLADKWEEGYLSLVNYIKREGHARVPQKYIAGDGYELGIWLSRQKTSKIRNTLSPEKIKKLEALPSWSWGIAAYNWEEAYSSLVNYIKLEGHARVPSKYETEDGFKLGPWVSRQKTYIKNNKLTPEKIKKLEEVPGWSWDLFADKWEEGYSQLVQFLKHERIIPTLYIKTKDGYNLGKWVSKQKQNKKIGVLTQDQIKKLEAVPGWSWNPFDERWEAACSQLAQYIKKNGSMPTFYFNTKDGFGLGRWIGKQKSQKKKGSLTPERIKRLEELEGWVWSVKK